MLIFNDIEDFWLLFCRSSEKSPLLSSQNAFDGLSAEIEHSLSKVSKVLGVSGGCGWVDLVGYIAV